MTRIISGTVGGRKLRVPPAGTRPTADRVREALFSVLASRIDFEGLRVLDLYAGSGALGLEALSRGAAHARLVESDGRAAAVVTRNITELGLTGASVSKASVATLLAAPPDDPYDLVLSDPPYDLPNSAVEADLLALLAGGWLAADALTVVERSVRTPPIDWPDGFDSPRRRDYGAG